jgi:signal transduction histidine kinase
MTTAKKAMPAKKVTTKEEAKQEQRVHFIASIPIWVTIIGVVIICVVVATGAALFTINDASKARNEQTRDFVRRIAQNSCEDRAAGRTDLRQVFIVSRTRIRELNPDSAEASLQFIDLLLEGLPPIECDANGQTSTRP